MIQTCDELAKGILATYIEQLCRESINKRISALHAKCPPVHDFWIRNHKFNFDPSRLEDLDQRRQDVLHRLAFMRVDDLQYRNDIQYLEHTSAYLLNLFAGHYDLQLWRPNDIVDFDLQISKGDRNYLNYEALLLASSLADSGESDLEIENYRGAIYARTADGVLERLALITPLSDLVVSHDEKHLAFVRYRQRTTEEELRYGWYGESPVGVAELYVADRDGRNQRRILCDGDPLDLPDSDYTKIFGNSIRGISRPQFSADGSRLYFLASAWATSHAVFYIDLNNDKVNYLTHGNVFQVLTDGAYAGSLLIEQHRYYPAPNYGSFDHRWLVSPEGEVLFDFDEKFGEEKSGN
jgi:hypothetical protein